MPNTIQDINRELASRINAEARSNPQSPYANKFVGIANGKVVVVADDLDELVRQLRLAEPDPKKCFGVEDGIACFSFINRFHYGNFGDPGLFGLEA